MAVRPPEPRCQPDAGRFGRRRRVWGGMNRQDPKGAFRQAGEVGGVLCVSLVGVTGTEVSGLGSCQEVMEVMEVSDDALDFGLVEGLIGFVFHRYCGLVHHCVLNEQGRTRPKRQGDAITRTSSEHMRAVVVFDDHLGQERAIVQIGDRHRANMRPQLFEGRHHQVMRARPGHFHAGERQRNRRGSAPPMKIGSTRVTVPGSLSNTTDAIRSGEATSCARR